MTTERKSKSIGGRNGQTGPRTVRLSVGHKFTLRPKPKIGTDSTSSEEEHFKYFDVATLVLKLRFS